jgi:hypothetical protein
MLVLCFREKGKGWVGLCLQVGREEKQHADALVQIICPYPVCLKRKQRHFGFSSLEKDRGEGVCLCSVRSMAL